MLQELNFPYQTQQCLSSSDYPFKPKLWMTLWTQCIAVILGATVSVWIFFSLYVHTGSVSMSVGGSILQHPKNDSVLMLVGDVVGWGVGSSILT